MRNILLLNILILFSCSGQKINQTDDNNSKTVQSILNMKFTSYPDLWQKVRNYEKDGRTKSAYEVVKLIYKTAKEDQNSPQIIKALLYQSKYMMQLEEDSQLKIIQNFEKEIAENSVPTKNILESYLAQLYWQYYQSNRWQFANRTETAAKVDPKDFRTWDLKTIFKEIEVHFDRSLQNENILQKLPVKKWQDILELSDEAIHYQPTLYDLLVQEALNFYQNKENGLTSPAYKFSIDSPDFLSNVDRFINLKINSKDSLSLQYKALKIYQKYLKNLIKNKANLDVIANADLKRLNFIYENAVFQNKDQVYLKQLEQFARKYAQSPVAALAYYYQARLLNKIGNDYQKNKDESVRWHKQKAIKICKTAINKYPKSKGSKQCRSLIDQIQRPEISLKVEANIPEEKPVLLHFNYRNVNNLTLEIYKATYEQIARLNKIYEKGKQINFIENLTLHKTYNFRLKNENDYQPHSTERIIDGLPNGEYVFLLKPEKALKPNFSFESIQATDVALQSISKTVNNVEHTVVDRMSGKAYPNAKVVIKKLNRSRNWQTYRTLKTNQQGSFLFKPNNNYYGNYLFVITYNNGKKAFFNQHMSRPYNPQAPRDFNTAFVFTDRSIYRPGQKVYFKLIALTKKPNHSEVLKNINLNVTLFDVNSQKIAEKILKTNDFGSAHGEFILPEQTLTGSFQLRISSNAHKIFNSKSIRVEAYKRPKFEVVIEKPDKTYRINDEISVEGLAQSFAGTNITNAKVTYRVHREVSMPRWWYWYRPQYRSDPQEITHGITQTDEKGKFVIKFKAIPDLSVKPENEPVFHYIVYAEVTDINGETHSKTITVNVGYKDLTAHILMPNIIKKTQQDTIKIETKNLNGVKVPANGKIQIFKLKVPDRILRTRPFNVPDYQEIDKTEFVSKLPHTPYDKQETAPEFWPEEKLSFETNFDTGKQAFVLVKPEKSWPSGKYIAVLTTKDKTGKPVTDKQIFDIIDNTEKTVADKQYFSILNTQDQYQPGQSVRLKLGSASTGNTIRVWVEKNHKIVDEKRFKTDGTYKTITVPITKSDLGGFVIRYAFNAFNDNRSKQIYINVPYPTDKLEIETLTFRDKLKPGQEEQWQFKIKGSESEKITAEVLASMYDASLDQFISHTWDFQPVNYRLYRSPLYFKQTGYGQKNLSVAFPFDYDENLNKIDEIARLKWFGFHFYNNRHIVIRGAKSLRSPGIHSKEVAVVSLESDTAPEEVAALQNKTIMPDDHSATGGSNVLQKENDNPVSLRTNFNETAFFYPEIYTDKDGNISFKFTMPESLTKWKLQLLAHTPDLKHGYKELFAQTQKDLMVFPNVPRFVREGDKLILSAKISNLTDKNLSGTVQIELTDPVKGKDLTANLLAGQIDKSFNVNAQGNTQVSWEIAIPENLGLLQYKITAKSGQQADAEQNILPVLSNRMLVTETMPMWVRSGQSKTFTMDKLVHQNSPTLKHHRLTLEITSNPAWYAVQALPYLIEYPYECSEQTFSRYYANSLGTHIINSKPKIKKVFEIWRQYQPEALWSNLEKNQELKSIIISETPWLRDAQSETEQKKRIALLFDFNKMRYERQQSLNKLRQLQLPGGGFVWFKGGRYPNRYITQHIVAGFGHLNHLGVSVREAERMIKKAVKYLDGEIASDYKKLLKYANKQKDPEAYLKKYHTGRNIIHYLYARSFYPDTKTALETKTAVDYYRKQAQKYWLSYGLYEQGLLALISQRHRDKEIARKIIRSLDENSIESDELGMYWKNNTGGWYWYQAPIETQALLIEAFDEITGDTKLIDEMRIWLLKHKQTNAWKTTKQTTEAVYALLLRGTDFLSLNDNVSVKVGSIKLNPESIPEIKTEAGTGYFKKSWTADQIKPEMGKVQITKKAKGIAWGALYWQYFEDLDKITNAKTPVAITKELFIRKFTDTGEKLYKITPQTTIKTGDLVRVRIEIKVDRDMEYVHLKDMRAAGFEPVNVLSQYKWQDGLGYYEATGDVATNFFISYLPKGIYVFEYDLRANNAGSYSNGITTLQCMYAPEFSSHSRGMHLNIK